VRSCEVVTIWPDPISCLHYNFLGSDGFPWFPWASTVVGKTSPPLDFKQTHRWKFIAIRLIAPFWADVPPLKRSAWWDGMEFVLCQFLLRSAKYCPPNAMPGTKPRTIDNFRPWMIMVGSYFLHENLKLEDFLRWVLRGPLSKTLRYTPENKTSHWGEIPIFHKKYIFKWWMFHCHLSFRGYPLRGTFRSKCLVFFKKLAPLAIPLAMLAPFHLPPPHLSWRPKLKCSPLKSYRDPIVVF